MKHQCSRPTDLSRGSVSSGAHGLQIWAYFARSPRIVQLVSALLHRAALRLDRQSRSHTTLQVCTCLSATTHELTQHWLNSGSR